MAREPEYKPDYEFLSKLDKLHPHPATSKWIQTEVTSLLRKAIILDLAQLGYTFYVDGRDGGGKMMRRSIYFLAVEILDSYLSEVIVALGDLEMVAKACYILATYQINDWNDLFIQKFASKTRTNLNTLQDMTFRVGQGLNCNIRFPTPYDWLESEIKPCEHPDTKASAYWLLMKAGEDFTFSKWSAEVRARSAL